MCGYFSPYVFGTWPVKMKSQANNDYDEVLGNIARNLRRIRKEKGFSQIRLAIESDVDKTYIGYIENMKHNVSVKVLCQLATSLEVDVEALIQ